MNIWESGIDGGAFWVQVVRSDDAYQGTLEVYRGPNAKGEKIYSEPVGISYGGPFGPDAWDVADWSDKAIQVVDAQ